MKYEFLKRTWCIQNLRCRERCPSKATLYIPCSAPDFKRKRQLGGQENNQHLLHRSIQRKIFGRLDECLEHKRTRTSTPLSLVLMNGIDPAIGPFGGEFSLDDSPLNIKMESIDSLIQVKKMLPKMDFVIATYVTPWSLTGREGDKEKYRRLLKKTISKNTTFLTVEPKRPPLASLKSHQKFPDMKALNTMKRFSNFKVHQSFGEKLSAWINRTSARRQSGHYKSVDQTMGVRQYDDASVDRVP